MPHTLAGLRDEIRRSVFGEAWHGAALFQAVARLSAAEAATNGVAGAHSVWEIVLHATGWMEEVAHRLQGHPPNLPARGDWPAVSDISEAAWAAALVDLERAHALIDAACAAFPPDRLDDQTSGADPVPSLGSGVSYRVMLHGLAQHNAYHTGQAVIIGRAAARG